MTIVAKRYEQEGRGQQRRTFDPDIAFQEIERELHTWDALLPRLL
jgi:hypothetical protein